MLLRPTGFRTNPFLFMPPWSTRAMTGVQKLKSSALLVNVFLQGGAKRKK
jgi:hypothetical protein